ncbi:MAG: ATP-binding SpoIIE family protein phosphatase [Sedimenticola sp.]
MDIKAIGNNEAESENRTPCLALYVSSEAEAIAAKRRTREVALAIGFPDAKSDELSVVASELALNLVKHADGGEYRVYEIRNENHHGLEITTRDHGPGIDDIHRVMRDGHSTAGSLGLGMGIVNRIMDELEICSPIADKFGCLITARRWLQGADQERAMCCSLDIGISSRPHPQMKVNGDAYVIHKWPNHVLIGVIDGLGHGQGAAKASESVARYLGDNFDADLESLLLGSHQVSSATRGVVMALLRFNCDDRVVFHACVGNVDCRQWSRKEKSLFPQRRGVVGSSMPSRVRVSRESYRPGDVFVINTDGVSSRWDWDDYPQIHGLSASEAARQLMLTHQRSIDDATIVVVKVGG